MYPRTSGACPLVWLCTPKGYLQVAQAEDPEILIVSARLRSCLRRALGDLLRAKKQKIYHVPSRDFAYRCFVPRRDFAELMAKMVQEINYTNLRLAVPRDASKDLSELYERVWYAGRTAQEREQAELKGEVELWDPT